MRQDQQRKLDSLYRVQDFMSTHADLLGTLRDAEARKQVDHAVAGIRDHITAQGSADRVLVGQNSRKQALARELVKTHMAPIAKFARANLRGVPDFSTLRKSGNVNKPKALIGNAFSMAKAATPYVNAMTAEGFPPDTIEQLTGAAETLDLATIERDNTKHRRVESTKNIAKLVRLGRDGVKKIDAVVSKHFVSDEAILAAWTSASRVYGKSGSVRKPTPAGTATPVGNTGAPVSSGATPVASATAPVPVATTPSVATTAAR